MGEALFRTITLTDWGPALANARARRALHNAQTKSFLHACLHSLNTSPIQAPPNNSSRTLLPETSALPTAENKR